MFNFYQSAKAQSVIVGKVLDESGKDYYLDLGFGPVARGQSECCMLLAKLPAFAHRKSTLDLTSRFAISGGNKNQIIALTSEGFDFIASGDRQTWVAPL